MTERWLRELRRLRQVEMPPGLWERARAGARGTGAERRPRSAGSRRTWSAIAAGVAIALIAGAVFLARGLTGAGGAPVGGRGGVYSDHRFGWTIRTPPGFLVHHLTGNFRWSLDGVRVTNFRPDLAHPTHSEPESGWLRTFPATGVAAQIWYLGGPGRLPAIGNGLPLRESSFHRVRPYTGGTEPAPAYHPFAADGYEFNAEVWVGPDARQADRRAIWKVIESLRFPRLREGTAFNDAVYVLGPAKNYPPGSVTVFRAESLPLIRYPRYTRGFYLVHGPRALYVIDRRFVPPGQTMTLCTVAFDRASSRFSCPGTKLRWDLAGRELAPHPRPKSGWSLSSLGVVISTNGHVLVSPSFDVSAWCVTCQAAHGA